MTVHLFLGYTCTKNEVVKISLEFSERRDVLKTEEQNTTLIIWWNGVITFISLGK